MNCSTTLQLKRRNTLVQKRFQEISRFHHLKKLKTTGNAHLSVLRNFEQVNGLEGYRVIAFVFYLCRVTMLYVVES